MRVLLEILQTLVLALVLYFLVDMVLGRVRVENISMLPTLQPGELILVNRLADKLGGYHTGDIVIFHYPANPEEDYIKRVIGTSGDKVEINAGQVLVNGVALNEDYISEAPRYTGVWDVPEDSFFVLGDNRNDSSDSHSWGFVPAGNMVGKALLVYWPFNNFQVLDHGPQSITSQGAQP